ncbi:Ligand of Numb protein X 2, partial [Fasciola gigantica]
TATESVTFKVARRHRADTPDILRIANGSNEQLQTLSSFRALRLNSSDATSSTPNVSDPVTRTDRSRRVESRCQQSNRSLCSAAMSSIATDSSSLKAFHVPSRASELISSSLSSSTEPFTVSKSTSQLLVDEEDRASSGTKEVTLTTGSTSPQCVERSVRHAPISATPQYPALPTCEERNVLVKKAPNEPLGISVAGGRHSQRGDTPVYVTNISPDCVLGRDKLVKRGDVLLEVNGIGLVGLTHNEAVNVIRRASSMRSRVDLRLIDAPETGEGPNNFMPSWTFWLQLPPICQLARTVRLVRNVVSSSSSSSGRLEPLGLTIVGGLGDGGPRPRPLLETEPATTDQTVSPERRRWGGYTSLYPCPIVIKSIVPGFLAARDGRLKCGDLILAVNNVSMLNIPHASAVRLLKQLQGDVALQIISWPGTIV